MDNGRNVSRLASSLAALALAGCAANGAVPPGACNAQQLMHECGGDLTGTWTLSCYEPLANGITIADAPAETITFDGAGRYALSASGQDYLVTVPATDFQPDGGVHAADCSALDGIAALFGGHCAAVAAGCACTYPQAALAESGSFATSGTRVTLMPTRSSPTGIVSENEGYCASGGILTMPVRFGNFLTSGSFVRARE
jgi:hypothetical protein